VEKLIPCLGLVQVNIAGTNLTAYLLFFMQ